jgi:hypothetical protein
MWTQKYNAYFSKMNEEQHPPKFSPHPMFFSLVFVYEAALNFSNFLWKNVENNSGNSIEENYSGLHLRHGKQHV